MKNNAGILMVNGIALTEEVICQLEYLQTNGFTNGENKKFDNSGVKEKVSEITEIIFYLLGVITNGSINEDFSTEISLLKSLYLMRESYTDFAVPENTKIDE